MAAALNEDDIHSALSTLEGWTFQGDAISRSFSFGSFREALSFLMRVGFEAEELNHHPEIFNVYSSVKLTLTTHDAGNKVTEKDLDLARRINKMCWI